MGQKKTKTSTSKVKTPPKITPKKDDNKSTTSPKVKAKPGLKPKPKMKKITKKKKAVVVSLDNNKAILEPTVGNSKLYTTPNKLNSNMNMNTTTTTANTTPYTTAPPNINYTTAPPPPPTTTITNNTPPQPTTTTPTRTRKPWDKPLCTSVAAINSRRRRARCKRKKEMIENALYHFQKKPSDFAFSEQKLELLDTPSLRKGNIATKGEISYHKEKRKMKDMVEFLKGCPEHSFPVGFDRDLLYPPDVVNWNMDNAKAIANEITTSSMLMSTTASSALPCHKKR